MHSVPQAIRNFNQAIVEKSEVIGSICVTAHRLGLQETFHRAVPIHAG